MDELNTNNVTVENEVAEVPETTATSSGLSTLAKAGIGGAVIAGGILVYLGIKKLVEVIGGKKEEDRSNKNEAIDAEYVDIDPMNSENEDKE